MQKEEKDKGKEKQQQQQQRSGKTKPSLAERRQQLQEKKEAESKEIQVETDDEEDSNIKTGGELAYWEARDLWMTGLNRKPSRSEQVWTVFFQGANTSQLQLGRYTGDWGFEATTGEDFVAQPGALQVIRYPFVGVEAPEVVYPEATPQGHYKWLRDGRHAASPGGSIPCVSELPAFCCHPLLWIGHNFSDISQDLLGFRAAPSGCCLPYNQKPENGVRLTAQSFALRMDRINLGQSRDVKVHRAKWKLLQKQLGAAEECGGHISDPDVVAAVRQGTAPPPQKHRAPRIRGKSSKNDDVEEGGEPETTSKVYPCILYGVSRGAAVTVQAMNRYKYPNVRLIVLEGCYDRLQDVMRRRYGRFLTPIIEFGLGMATEYQPGEMNPIDALHGLSHEIPVAFITSHADRYVPVHLVMRMVWALRKDGHERVHVLQLWHARHGNYTHGHRVDSEAYQSWLHALYRLYELPHVRGYADAGQDLLDETPGGGQDRWFRTQYGHKFQDKRKPTDSDPDTSDSGSG